MSEINQIDYVLISVFVSCICILIACQIISSLYKYYVGNDKQFFKAFKRKIPKFKTKTQNYNPKKYDYIKPNINKKPDFDFVDFELM